MEFEKSFLLEEAATQDNTLKPTHYSVPPANSTARNSFIDYFRF